MTTNDINEMLKKLMKEGKGAFEALELIENSGLFNKKTIDEWFEKFNNFRQKSNT